MTGCEGDRSEPFFDLAQPFRATEDPQVARQLGDELGRMIFGD